MRSGCFAGSDKFFPLVFPLRHTTYEHLNLHLGLISAVRHWVVTPCMLTDGRWASFKTMLMMVPITLAMLAGLSSRPIKVLIRVRTFGLCLQHRTPRDGDGDNYPFGIFGAPSSAGESAHDKPLRHAQPSAVEHTGTGLYTTRCLKSVPDASALSCAMHEVFAKPTLCSAAARQPDNIETFIPHDITQ